MKFLLILLLATGACYGACAGSWGNGYTYCRSVTFDHTKVGSTDQSNFPVPFIETDATFKTVANGGHVQHATTCCAASGAAPADFIFTSDSAGSTLLNWDTKLYDATTGQVIMFVKTTVSHTADTEIFLFYGKAAVSTYQATYTSAYDSNFKAVLHFGDGSTLSVADSTGTGNGTNHSGTATSGLNDGAVSLNGTTAYVSSPTISTTTVSYSVWVNSATLTTCVGCALGIKNPSNNDWLIYINAGSITTQGGSVGYADAGGHLANNTWLLISFSLTGSTAFTYVNGVQVATGTAGPVSNTGGLINYGDIDDGGGFFFPGKLEEARVSTSVRSADWFLAEYNSYFSPATFTTLGTESSGSTAPPSQPFVIVVL